MAQEVRGKCADLNFWASQDAFHLQECSIMELASFNGVEGTYEHVFLGGGIHLTLSMRHHHRQGKIQRRSA